MDFIESLLLTAVRMSIPVLLAALGMVVSERAGIVNIGAEGIMLVGAFTGFAGAYFFGGTVYGLLCAMLFGAMVGVLFAFLVISVQANQTVVGVAINLLGSGLTVLLNRIIFDGISTSGITTIGLSTVKIPILSDIPLVGGVLFSHNPVVYLAFGLVFATHFFLYKTNLGLSVRGVGEHPRACDTVGIKVYRLRYLSSIYACALCGFAGAYMSIVQMSSFTEGMVYGRGYIALAAVIFGKWKPKGILLAVLIFGLGESLQYKLLASSVGIPYQFSQMLPYVLTLIALTRISKESVAPAASGIPYIKE